MLVAAGRRDGATPLLAALNTLDGTVIGRNIERYRQARPTTLQHQGPHTGL